MKFSFIAAEKAHYSVDVLCSALGVSRSGCYAWQGRKEPRRRARDRQLGLEVEAIYCGTHQAYGSPRIHRELAARGVHVSKKRVARLLRERGLSARRPKRFRRTTDSNHSQPIAPNLVARNFRAEAPNQVWVGDITYLWTAQGWLYLAILMDLFSRRVVGWSLSPSLEQRSPWRRSIRRSKRADRRRGSSSTTIGASSTPVRRIESAWSGRGFGRA